MKVDLHVHSKFSKNPSEWVLRKLGTRESYTDPEDLYEIAKRRGMDAVTITDHNSIEGCLAIAHLPDTFISCEYTAYFPINPCKVHVLCYHITPEQHETIQGIRSDIFNMAAYLKEIGIVHSLAHPFFSPDGRLTPDNLRQLLELFDTFELNAAKDVKVNQYLRTLLNATKPGHKLTAGSDDHSMLTIAKMWTEVPEAKNIPEFVEGVFRGKCIVNGTASTPHTLAWNICSVGWQWLKKSDIANGFTGTLDQHLIPPEKRQPLSFAQRIWRNTRSMSPKKLGVTIPLNYVNKELKNIDLWSLRTCPKDKRWFQIVDTITNKYINKFGNRIIEEFTDKMLLGALSSLGMHVGLHAVLAPFLVAFKNFASQRALALKVLDAHTPDGHRSPRVAKFTDTFGTVDGVSQTLDEQLREARRTGKDYTIISCVAGQDFPGLKYFSPVGMLAAPEFAQQKLCWPPLLKILEYCYEEEFTLIQAATPGPVGLAGLIVARTLGLPFHAVYHTQVPEFIGRVTGDLFMEEVALKYCLWFYDSADVIFAPSNHTKQDLMNRGIRSDKIRVYPRGIDTERFNPTKRTNYWQAKWGIDDDSAKALYVGRVSKEKNLALLVGAFRKLVDQPRIGEGSLRQRPLALLVVGDGGFRQEMAAQSAGYPVVFAGELHGEELAYAFASADFFVFPSTTDTYGRAVVEAMASGLPCIVSEAGGPAEHVTHEVNGLIIPADDEAALIGAMKRMIISADRQQMGKRAREFAEKRCFSEAFREYWSLYAA